MDEKASLAILYAVIGFLSGMCYMEGMSHGFTLDHWAALTLSLGTLVFLIYLEVITSRPKSPSKTPHA